MYTKTRAAAPAKAAAQRCEKRDGFPDTILDRGIRRTLVEVSVNLEIVELTTFDKL